MHEYWHKQVDYIFLSILIGHTPFSDKQIINYAFYKICTKSGNKNRAGNNLHPGSTWPKAADRWARGHVGEPGWPGRLGQRPSPTCSQTPAMAGRGRRDDAGKGRGRGPGGPGAHPGCAGGLGLAGGWPAASNLAAASSVLRRGIRDVGGDSRHFGPIPSRGRLKAARRTYSARREAGGSTGSAAIGGVHGAACRSLGGRARGREAREREREREEEASWRSR
jgi:hypothetical protein